ncbi:phosphoprotein phosphatase [Niastella yeongjuensis]|uniref:Phosphoprotein phosphatase n=1 Tax=Niastella yeongjuensis TaxID=354355 RepID=A0A1V9DYA7_9BACT|nr:HAD family hydrolase [Niastella yeongjuensis]OQP38820.1 phosphoprotein phosphatase [Niastella yeongjuensis]SEO31292.1 NLI interacting factor-like phosphatase [Niastella yeongjuensis]
MESKSDKLIIFDLDETLIHANGAELGYPAHFMFDAYYVYERPGVRSFLSDIARHFTIGIWSSASDDYVAEIVDHIMPATIEPLVVWGRSKCTMKRDYEYDTYYYEKRLDKLKKKGFRLEQILIVDDSPEKARTNYGNAVYIKEFTGDGNDKELQFLFNYLLTFKTTANVRTVEKRGWRNFSS